MSQRMNVVVATKYKKRGEDEEKTSFTTVGSAFINDDGGEITSINIKLDFPVGVQELILFPPKEKS